MRSSCFTEPENHPTPWRDCQIVLVKRSLSRVWKQARLKRLFWESRTESAKQWKRNLEMVISIHDGCETPQFVSSNLSFCCSSRPKGRKVIHSSILLGMWCVKRQIPQLLDRDIQSEISKFLYGTIRNERLAQARHDPGSGLWGTRCPWQLWKWSVNFVGSIGISILKTDTQVRVRKREKNLLLLALSVVESLAGPLWAELAWFWPVPPLLALPPEDIFKSVRYHLKNSPL